MLNLAEYRKKNAQAFADFLPWAALVAPGVDRSTRTDRFNGRRGFAVPISTAPRRPNWSATTARLNNALRRLGSGWADLRRSTASCPPTDYPRKPAFRNLPPALGRHRTPRAVRGLRRHCSRASYFLTFVWLPPAEEADRAWKPGSTRAVSAVPASDRPGRLLTELSSIVPTACWQSRSKASCRKPTGSIRLGNADLPAFDHFDQTPSPCACRKRQCTSTRCWPIEPLAGGLEPRLGDFAPVRTLTVARLPDARHSPESSTTSTAWPSSYRWCDARHHARQDRRNEACCHENPPAVVCKAQIRSRRS